MHLLEFQGKRLLRKYGIKIPKSSLVTSPSEVTRNMFPGIVKAQVQTGRRGKAGGVQYADGLEKGKEIVTSLLGSNLLGETVSALLIEELVGFDHELFLALLIDQELNQIYDTGEGRYLSTCAHTM